MALECFTKPVVGRDIARFDCPNKLWVGIKLISNKVSIAFCKVTGSFPCRSECWIEDLNSKVSGSIRSYNCCCSASLDSVYCGAAKNRYTRVHVKYSAQCCGVLFSGALDFSEVAGRRRRENKQAICTTCSWNLYAGSVRCFPAGLSSIRCIVMLGADKSDISNWANASS